MALMQAVHCKVGKHPERLNLFSGRSFNQERHTHQCTSSKLDLCFITSPWVTSCDWHSHTHIYCVWMKDLSHPSGIPYMRVTSEYIPICVLEQWRNLLSVTLSEDMFLKPNQYKANGYFSTLKWILCLLTPHTFTDPLLSLVSHWYLASLSILNSFKLS